jgi:hypothetical protein
LHYKITIKLEQMSDYTACMLISFNTSSWP